jgi:ABC-type transporter Mla maintaining outer membrane lipid asymmetry ATPase subunit MlaF
MPLLDVELPQGHVLRGEKRRLVMPRRYQLDWLKKMAMPGSRIWLESSEGDFPGGGEQFAQRVACMLHQCNMLANLSLRENILLPFLYAGRAEEIARATVALQEVATRLEIAEKLDEQAGERSTYMHALIGLGRAMLMRPDFMVVQDALSGIQPHRQDMFRSLFCDVVEQLGVGVLYLSASEQDGSGLDYCQSLAFASAEENL